MINKKNQKLGLYKFLHILYTFLAYISLCGSIALVIIYNVLSIKINITIEYLSILILTVGLSVYFRINSLHYHSSIYLIENLSHKSGEVRRSIEKKHRSKY